jgi:hypothetical protein
MIMLPAEVATILVLHSSFFELRGWRVMVLLGGDEESGKRKRRERKRRKRRGREEQYIVSPL